MKNTDLSKTSNFSDGKIVGNGNIDMAKISSPKAHQKEAHSKLKQPEKSLKGSVSNVRRVK